MKILSFLPISAALALTIGTARAQYGPGAVALHWSGTTSQGGTFCWGFSCTPIPLTASAGESVELLVRGELNQPYAIAISAGASRCLPIPGIFHDLILDDPVIFFHFGWLVRQSPILACPPGYDTLAATLPSFLPAGTLFYLQALAGSNGVAGPQPAFTAALGVLIR